MRYLLEYLVGSGVKQVTDRVARYLVRTILAGPNNKNKKKATSAKPQARATICHIDTRCRGATIESLTLLLVSYIIVDMLNKKGETTWVIE
jgi:hypothetical protein